MKEMLEKLEKGDIQIPTFVGLKFTCNDLSMGGSLVTINPQKYSIFLGKTTSCYLLGSDINIAPKYIVAARLRKSLFGYGLCSLRL